MENECKKCGCDDAITVAPCLDPTGCPEPQKCDDGSFDSACVTYTGGDLKCGTQTIIANNTSIEQALQNLVTKACSVNNDALNITIDNNEYTLSAIVTGGQGPYQYLWSIAQGLFVGHEVLNNEYTLANLNLAPISGNSLQVGGISGATGAVYISHIKLDVTDANGSKKTIFYTLTNLV